MNIPFAKPNLDKKDIYKIVKTLKSPILTHGPNSINFENFFIKKFKYKYAHTVSNCTAALHMSYMAIKLGKGDEIIVPNQTHVSTVHAAEILGAKPIFVDCELSTGNINLEEIKKKITKKTKAITVVHYLGKPVNIEEIAKFCKKKKIYLIEDCALSLGAKFKNGFVGSFGDFACFSFYPAKHITTADGGMLVCKKEKDFKKVKLLKGFGVDKNFNERKIPGNYDVKSLGLNYRLDEIRCALGISQLKKLDRFIKLRKQNYSFLKQMLSDVKNISILDLDSRMNFKSSYYCFSIILKKKIKKHRFKIIKEIKSRGIGTSIHYPKPVSDYTYYKNKYRLKSKLFPNASIMSYSSINLPVGPHLKKKDLYYIVKTIKKIFSKY